MTQPTNDPHATNRHITTLSVTVAVILVTLKTFAFGASGSMSIMASLTDSALDLVASLVTFFAVRWAAAAPDAGHRYGHGKAESLAALVQSGLVMASAVFIGLESIKRIFQPQPVTSGMIAIIVMAISMALTGWLVWKQTRAIKQTGSLAVSGDRAHFSADLAANAVVMIGLVSGTFLNAPGLDAAAGLVVAVWLGWGAIGLLKDAGRHLMDAAAPDDVRNGITAAVLDDSRISNLHQLRTRQSGNTLMVQMHVDLDPDLSLIAAHDIVVAAEKRVMARYPNADIIIHADPANVSRHSVDDLAIEADIPASPSQEKEEAEEASGKGPWG